MKLSLDYWDVSRILPHIFESSAQLSLFFMSTGNGDIPVPRLRSGTPQQQPVHAPAHVSEVGLVAPLELDSGAP